MAVGRSRSDSDALGGVVNGYAPLDSNLLIPPAYLPTGIINLSPISDTYISQNATTTNYETATLLSIADRISAAGGFLKTALFKFDLSSLTGDVIRADLYLHQEATTNAGVFSGHIGVRKVLQTVVMAEATYNVYSTGNSWTVAGCRGNTDAVQWFDTTFWSSPSNATVQWMVIDATATIRRAILDGDTSVVLQVGAVEVTTGSQNPLDIASQDNATVANRPILSVVTGGGSGGGGGSSSPLLSHTGHVRGATLVAKGPLVSGNVMFMSICSIQYAIASIAQTGVTWTFVDAGNLLTGNINRTELWKGVIGSGAKSKIVVTQSGGTNTIHCIAAEFTYAGTVGSNGNATEATASDLTVGTNITSSAGDLIVVALGHRGSPEVPPGIFNTTGMVAIDAVGIISNAQGHAGNLAWWVSDGTAITPKMENLGDNKCAAYAVVTG